MKPAHLALFAAAGMLFTSFSVYSVTPDGGFRRAEAVQAAPETTPETGGDTTQAPVDADASRFTTQGTLAVDARLGRGKVAPGSEQFVMIEVTSGQGVKGKGAAPVNLALVIDRSGSMRGSRIRNAIRAATAAVDRLHEDDVVSVVTFDTQVQVVVPPTHMTGGTRESVNDAIRHIALGGDTCISCGIEQGVQLLGQTSGKVNRMIVLSDGDANHGIRDLPGFRAEAQRARDHGVTITTIGVDVEYNEKVLAAIAQESNGRHYFVENDEALSRAFEQEAETLTSTLASEAEATIELPPGVELDRVFDRSFRRAGNAVVVPLGSFSAADTKTVLLRVRVPAGASGSVAIAKVDLAYKDLVTGQAGRATGRLAAEAVTSGAQPADIDPVVTSRVQRSETAQVLKEANTLFEQGHADEARRKVAAQESNLRAIGDKASAAAAPAKKGAVTADINNQLSALGNSGFAAAPSASPANNGGFASPPRPAAAPPSRESREGRGAVRRNQERASDMAL